MGAVTYCLRRRFDQMSRFRFEEGSPNECAGQSLTGSTRLNWSIFGRRLQLRTAARKPLPSALLGGSA